MELVLMILFLLPFHSTSDSIIAKPSKVSDNKTDSVCFVINKISQDTIKKEKPFVANSFFKPEFIGGKEALDIFILNNAKYPKSAIKEGVSGIVSISFIVHKDGTIEFYKITNSLNKDCNKEIIRILNIMPPWKAGKSEGFTLPMYCNMSFVFSISDNRKGKIFIKSINDQYIF